MADLYSLIYDNIPVPAGLEFLYPIFFVIFLLVGIILAFALIDCIFHFFKRG